MKWSDLPLEPSTKALRQFAAAWLGFFNGIGLYQWLIKGRMEIGLAICLAGVVIGVVGLLKPAAVRWIFVSWMVLAFPIGWAISQLTLVVLFFGIITPVAIFFRLRGRDLLSRKPGPERASFWIDKTMPREARSYLNQY